MNPLLRIALIALALSPAYWVAARVRRAIIERHPDIWNEIRKPPDVYNSLAFFWSDRHAALGDADLSRKIWQYRWVSIGSSLLMLMMAAATSGI